MKPTRVVMVLAALAVLGGQAWPDEASSSECGQRVSRASDTYWDQIKRCGCESVDATPRASVDYDRWAAACDEWRRSHPTSTASPSPSPSPAAVLKVEPRPRRAPDCQAAPSRTSDAYWKYIDRCGCAGVDAVPRASLDYDRWAAACDKWRRDNPNRSQP
jgi:hypothetical protein